ncbi:hypothetical protein MCC93_10560 [Morococcus cerebrosus]|uniref:Uncharacterized protein n=1 Tax=Morococcus cerebrosus TaxID=1056807 RepID=A0A0C1EA19_9NEIS|nr:hypothetical protein MCC93_10560 [Morococcus cerebrosus]
MHWRDPLRSFCEIRYTHFSETRCARFQTTLFKNNHQGRLK